MDIIFEQIKDTGLIKLNRPKVLNALNYDMSEKFSYQLGKWEKDDNIKRVLLIGEGKNFCAGGDVKCLSLKGKETELRKNFFFSEYKLNYQISNFSKPYLSLWNGVVMGGGLGLSLYGKYRIVTDTTKIAMPETAIGFFPDVGGSYFLSRMKNNFGMFLGLTGHIINANEIMNLGLGTHYCPSHLTNNLIDEYIMTGNFKNFQIAKKYDDDSLEGRDFINVCFTGNISDIFIKLEKSQEKQGVRYLEILKKRCPMSLAVTHELLQRGKYKNLRECLEMEYQLGQNMIYRDDFDQGIDAVLVSKHHKPNWKPRSVDDISKNDINKLFEFYGKKLEL